MKYEFKHIPVMKKEVIEYLRPKKGDIYIDGTLGGGGHSYAIAKKIGTKGKIIGIDQDLEAIEAAKERLKDFVGRVIFVNDNFCNLSEILDGLKVEKVDGILLDLGVSSYQLENIDRGFSFKEDGENVNTRLDMRMNQNQMVSAYDVINKYPEEKLRMVLFKYGEEPFGRRIARNIVEKRSVCPIETTNDLLGVIKSSTPPKYRFGREKGHFASKVFRAIRMEVNSELGVLQEVIPQAIERLNVGGRLVIISFHSLEDRIVKHKFRDYDIEGIVKVLTKKPILPSSAEIEVNPRAESGKLRAVEKLLS